jgi:tetratricopeptide (TPR) repeat protein
MVRPLLISFIVLTTLQVSGQKMPSDYFDEATTLYQNEELDKALEAYLYIVENHPNNHLYPRSLYNAAYLHYKLEHDKAAIEMFVSILESDFNDKESSGGGIMSNPFANYRHNASFFISQIYYRNKKYELALEYFAKADTLYPYLSICGLDETWSDTRTDTRYGLIYYRLGQTQKSLNYLLPHALESNPVDAEVITCLKDMLSTEKGLAKKLDLAIVNMKERDFKGHRSTGKQYYFNFLNTNINVPYLEETDDNAINREKAINFVKESAFYIMIQNL